LVKRTGRTPVSPLFKAALFISLAAACAQPPASPSITLSIPDNDPAAAFVEVRGLSASDLASLKARELTRDEWSSLLRVSVHGDGATAVLPVAGAYEVTRDGIRFKPMFPLDAGRLYDVRFDPRRLGRTDAGTAGSTDPVVATVSLPKKDVAPSTVVSAVYPSTDTIPENQLRFYIHFSAPMGRKGGLEYIHLVDERGTEVKDPFLPLDTEFWNGDRTRYTVFVDPGRVKRGVLPNEQMGRSLTRGRTYTLRVDPEWRDAQGLPLKEPFRREFHVGPADERPLDTATWTIAAPSARTRDPLVVSFPEPLDHGLLQRAVGVANDAGSPLTGEVTIDQQERRWRFTPRTEWSAGGYRLVILPILEDLAGNRIGRAFEVDRFDQVDRAETDRIIVPFSIR
jgi:hypothetical protein